MTAVQTERSDRRSRFVVWCVAIAFAAFVVAFAMLQFLPHGLRVGESRRVTVEVSTGGMCRGVGFRLDGQDWSNETQAIPASWAGTVRGTFTRTGADTGLLIQDGSGEQVEMSGGQWKMTCFIN
jgi:hypothetical protein